MSASGSEGWGEGGEAGTRCGRSVYALRRGGREDEGVRDGGREGRRRVRRARRGFCRQRSSSGQSLPAQRLSPPLPGTGARCSPVTPPCHPSTAINPPCAATAHSNACLSLLSAAQFYAVPPDNLLTALSSFPTEALTRHITGRVLPRIVQLQQLVAFRRPHRVIDSHQLIQYRVRRWCEKALTEALSSYVLLQL